MPVNWKGLANLATCWKGKAVIKRIAGREVLRQQSKQSRIIFLAINQHLTGQNLLRTIAISCSGPDGLSSWKWHRNLLKLEEINHIWVRHNSKQSSPPVHNDEIRYANVFVEKTMSKMSNSKNCYTSCSDPTSHLMQCWSVLASCLVGIPLSRYDVMKH